MNRKKILILTSLLLIILLSGCSGASFNGFRQGYQDPATINYFVGTQGLTLEFMEEAPPQTVFEGSAFDVQTIIHNKGAYDVINEEEIQIEIVTDSANAQQLQTQGLENFYLRDLGYAQLHGKSYFYPEGEREFFALNRYEARDIIGGFEKNSIEFYVTMCYPYRTYFSDEVCIDTNADKLDVRRQVCSSENKNYGKGQGAPVEITAVESNMVPKGAYIEPQFVIYLEHSGDGIVSLYDSANKDANTCDEIGKDQINKMELHVTLGNDTLECFPNPVFFRDGEAKIECRLFGSQVLATAANYFTSLNVELRYLYTQTFDKQIQVRRTDSAAWSGAIDFEYEDCPPWKVWDATTDTCQSKCSYCAKNPTSVECSVSDISVFDDAKTKTFSENHACVYTRSECIEAKDNCILENSQFCMPGVYCGQPECAYNSRKNSRPRVDLEQGVPEGKIIFYCEDRDNTVDLASSCGCSLEAEYVVLPNGKTNCNQDNLTYNVVTGGEHTPATLKTYYTIPVDSSFPNDPEAICLKVKDVRGEERITKAYFDCLDTEVCFK